jgi:hypothetical protein
MSEEFSPRAGVHQVLQRRDTLLLQASGEWQRDRFVRVVS